MSLVIPENLIVPASANTRLLMGGTSDSSHSMLESMRLHGYKVAVANIFSPVSKQLRMLLSHVDVVLLDVTTSNRDVYETVHALTTTIGICKVRPRLLCFSTAHRNPHFVLGIEKSGARYVRVANPSMLIEAVDLLVARDGGA